MDIGVLDNLYRDNPVLRPEEDVTMTAEDADFAQEANQHKMGAFGNLQASAMLSAVAALVPHVNRLLAAHHVDRDALSMVSSIHIIRLYVVIPAVVVSVPVSQSVLLFLSPDVMFINKESLIALQVFPPDLQSASSFAAAGPSTSKDSLSLFALLNNTKTPGGKDLLKNWLMRPSAHLPTITARHDAVECLSKSSNRL